MLCEQRGLSTDRFLAARLQSLVGAESLGHLLMLAAAQSRKRTGDAIPGYVYMVSFAWGQDGEWNSGTEGGRGAWVWQA